MDTFITFMQSNWEWIAGLGTLIFGGAGWLIVQKLNKQAPPAVIPSDVGTVAMTALSEKYGKTIDDQQQTIDSLRKAVDALTTEQSDPDAPEGVDEALACLEQGDTGKAEAIFNKILETKESEGQASLKEAAQAAKHIGALAFLHDTEKALTAYKKAAELDSGDADAWNRLGGLLLRKGDLNRAERALNKVLALGNSIADKRIIAMATGNLGIIARTRGDLNQAEDYLQQSIAINKKLGDTENMGVSLGNIGLINLERGKLDVAEDYFQHALAINDEIGRKEGMASQLGNLGLVARTRGDLDRAEDYHQRSLAIATELGRKEGMASQLGNLGLVALYRHDLDQAEDYFHQSLTIDKELGRKEYIANQLCNLGAVAKVRGDMPEACRLWREALGLYQVIGMPHTVEQVQGWLDEDGCDGDAPAE